MFYILYLIFMVIQGLTLNKMGFELNTPQYWIVILCTAAAALCLKAA